MQNTSRSASKKNNPIVLAIQKVLALTLIPFTPFILLALIFSSTKTTEICSWPSATISEFLSYFDAGELTIVMTTTCFYFFASIKSDHVEIPDKLKVALIISGLCVLGGGMILGIYPRFEVKLPTLTNYLLCVLYILILCCYGWSEWFLEIVDNSTAKSINDKTPDDIEESMTEEKTRKPINPIIEEARALKKKELTNE